jgi:hypothetical protein
MFRLKVLVLGLTIEQDHTAFHLDGIECRNLSSAPLLTRCGTYGTSTRAALLDYSRYVGFLAIGVAPQAENK